MTPNDEKAPEVRIIGRADQKAQAAAMIGAHELRLFTYYQPYDLRHADQYAALVAVYRQEFNRDCPAPAGGGDSPIRYLLVFDGEPVLLTEAEVPAFVFGAAISKGEGRGWTSATKVLYRDGLLS